MSLASVSGLVWYCLVKVANITQGHNVLIHDAFQHIGQAAIQLVQHLKTKLFVTVLSAAEKKVLHERYGIPECAIFELSSPSYERDILASTGGRGVDLLLDSTSSQNQQPYSLCLAPQARLIYIGNSNSLGAVQGLQTPLRRLETMHFVDHEYIQREQPALATEMLRGGFELLKRGVMMPIANDDNVLVSKITGSEWFWQTLTNPFICIDGISSSSVLNRVIGLTSSSRQSLSSGLRLAILQ